MSFGWINLPLNECLDMLIDYRGKTPDKCTAGVPLVTAKIIKNGRIEPPMEFIAFDDYESWMQRGIPEEGDVVMTTEAPLGEVAQVGKDTIALAQRVIALRGKAELLDNTYLLYLFQTEEMQEQLKSRATGTTVLGIKQSELRKITICIPPLGFQKEVASILASIDKRIDLLQKTNATLESIAQALFKSWFIDFDPVRAKAEDREPEGMDAETAALFPDSFEESELGLIPEGWKIAKIVDLLELSYGKALKATDRIFGSVPVYGSGGITGYHNQPLVTKPSIIIGRKGTVGSLYWEDQPFYPIDTVFYVKTKKPLTYCYYLLKTLGLNEMNTDAAVPGLNRNNAYRLPIIIGSNEIINAFDAIVSSLRNKIFFNTQKIESLITLRDVLLPKLISGQLRLSEGDKKLRST